MVNFVWYSMSDITQDAYPPHREWEYTIMTYEFEKIIYLTPTSIVHQYSTVLSAPYLIPTNDRITTRSDLYTWVHVIEDVVIFQHAMSIVVEVYTDLSAEG